MQDCQSNSPWVRFRTATISLRTAVPKHPLAATRLSIRALPKSQPCWNHAEAKTDNLQNDPPWSATTAAYRFSRSVRPCRVHPHARVDAHAARPAPTPHEAHYRPHQVPPHSAAAAGVRASAHALSKLEIKYVGDREELNGVQMTGLNMMDRR